MSVKQLRGKLFSEDVTTIFDEKDFEDTPKNGNEKDRTEFSLVKNGKFYDVRWLYFPPCGAFRDGMIEARVNVDSEDPSVKRYQDRIHQSCFVYFIPPEKKKSIYKRCKNSTDSFAIGNFQVTDYRHKVCKQEFCVYCNCQNLCRSSNNHKSTIKHKDNVKKFILGLALTSKLPESIIMDIMSYVY